MNKEDYPSDSDQSDEDFCPENIDSEEVSVDESNESNVESGEDECPKGKGTTKKKKRNKRHKRKPENQDRDEEASESPKKVENQGLNEEAEKKRSDALWADFLSDVNGSSKGSEDSSKASSVTNTSQIARVEKTTINSPLPEKKKITEVYDFAGEEVKIIKEVPANHEGGCRTESSQQSTDVSKPPRGAPVKRPAGGLNSVLNSIGKKSKISVLEKSKLDWDTFKRSEGLSDELKTYNKGREGYLERRDFLERTDLRQFEIEKSLRQSKRSNR